MCTKANSRLRECPTTSRLNPAKVLAPASPALHGIVVAENGTSSSGGMPDRRPIGIDMGVKIDEAGRHQLAFGIDALFGRAPQEMLGSTAATCPKRMPISRMPRRFWLGSMTSPPRITRSNSQWAAGRTSPRMPQATPSLAAPPANTSRREILATDISAPEPKSVGRR